MRVLIIEEALEDGGGHWPSYIGELAKSFRETGDTVDILGHKGASSRLMKNLGVTPWFSRNCWKDKRSQGGVGGIVHNWLFRKELVAWIDENKPYDVICALTVRTQHLLAFASLSESSARRKGAKIQLLFVQGFGRYGGMNKPSYFPNTLSNKLARLCFWRMRKAIDRQELFLSAETKQMCKDLEFFTGKEVSLFPHPVPASPHKELSNPSEQIMISCPGFARHEKGSDLLQEAIIMALNSEIGSKLSFVLQWPEPFEIEDGTLLGVREELSMDPRVIFKNENMNAQEYEQLLFDSDLVILPYRRESYYNRLSRVAIEAAARGIPLIYMSGTWAEEVANMVGAGIPIPEESPESIWLAIQQAVSSYEELNCIASERLWDVAEFHSGAHFRKEMVSKLCLLEDR